MHKQTKDFSLKAIVLLFTVLTLVGLLAGLSYSMSVDENAEYEILRSNIAEYASKFGLSLGSRVTLISESIEKDHGISVYYFVAPFCIIANRISQYALHTLWHAWTFIVFMFGVLSVYGITRNLLHTSRRFAFASALLLYTTPRMFAEGHYNNKDIVLLALVFLIMYSGILFIQKNHWSNAVFFSIAGAFAANTKVIGAWVWGVFGLLFLTIRLLHRQMSRRTWFNGILAILTFIFVYFILTPAMWSNPLGFITYLTRNALQFSRWNYFVLFEGQLTSYYTGDSIPWYYLPKFISMTLPVPILFLFLFGTAKVAFKLITVRKHTTDKQDIILTLTAILLSGFIPLVIGMFSDMIVYNGWRHFYFVYSSILLLCIYALHSITVFCNAHHRLQYVVPCMLGMYFVYHSIGLARNHPLQGSYFNLFAAPYVANNYEVDYWVLSTGPAAKKISEHAAANHIPSPTFTSTPFMLGGLSAEIINAMRSPNLQYVRDSSFADYYIEYVDYAAIAKELPDDVLSRVSDDAYEIRHWNDNNEFEEIFSLYSYGAKTCTVYARIR